MFTGIVEWLGVIAAVEPDSEAVRLRVRRPAGWSECKVGDSVAVNGCCLTIVELDGDQLAFQAGSETLAKTNLGALQSGSAVNLERALAAGGRLDGHIVQGHVDGTAAIDDVRAAGDWVFMTFRVAAELTAQMVPKGSIAVDGVSLTLVDVEAERFDVALIPHTLEVTTLGSRRSGDVVNIETDILGKYVLKHLAQMQV